MNIILTESGLAIRLSHLRDLLREPDPVTICGHDFHVLYLKYVVEYCESLGMRDDDYVEFRRRQSGDDSAADTDKSDSETE